MRRLPSEIGPLILVLDVGSSSVRASLFDRGGRSLPPAPGTQRRYQWNVVPDGAMECDPEFLIGEVVATIDAALAQVRNDGTEIEAVAIAAFWHSVMGVSADGSPGTPVFGWGDIRAADTALALRGGVDAVALHRRTGCFLNPSYPSVKLAWLRGRDPGAFARHAAWVSFPEYLEERLLGARRCSTSMASGSGLMDVHRQAWDEEALAMAGVAPGQLSPLVEAGESTRGLSRVFVTRWPELNDVPWFPSLGDGACANAGSGAVGPRRLGMTVGTSAAVRALWEPAGDVDVPEDLWCYRLDGRRWVAGGALSNGGNAVAYLRRTLKLGSPADMEAAVAAREADSHGLTILPFLLGERGPGWREERLAVVLGMTDNTAPVEILQGWMEAVGYRIARVTGRLEQIVGPAQEVVASGGALHSSPAWTQILADTLGRPVSLPAEREDTSRGAALVALERLGHIRDLRALEQRPAARFEPRPDAHRRHRAAMQRQQRVLDAAIPWLADSAPAASDRSQPTT